MLSYSVDGYLNSVLKFRSAKTIMVEGDSDKSVVSRLLHGLSVVTNVNIPKTLVDTASIIKTTEVVGNRERVELVHSSVKKFEEVEKKFAGFVDREYRNFELQSTIQDNAPYHFVVDGNLFWTRGHSIENYFIDLDCLASVIIDQFAGQVTSNVREVLAPHFLSILRHCAVVSIAAFSSNLLGRLGSGFDISLWHYDSQNVIGLDFAELERLLRLRGATLDSVMHFSEEFSRLSLLIQQTDEATIRWLIHGHTGYHLMWSAIAYLFSLQNGDDEVASSVITDIAQGQQQVKLKLSAAFWSHQLLKLKEKSDMPLSFINWIIKN